MEPTVPGCSVAVYRIVVQGWSKEEAILEMQKGGFGFHNTYTNIVKISSDLRPGKFRRALNLDKTKGSKTISISDSRRRLTIG